MATNNPTDAGEDYIDNLVDYAQERLRGKPGKVKPAEINAWARYTRAKNEREKIRLKQERIEKEEKKRRGENEDKEFNYKQKIKYLIGRGPTPVSNIPSNQGEGRAYSAAANRILSGLGDFAGVAARGAILSRMNKNKKIESTPSTEPKPTPLLAPAKPTPLLSPAKDPVPPPVSTTQPTTPSPTSNRRPPLGSQGNRLSISRIRRNKQRHRYIRDLESMAMANVPGYTPEKIDTPARKNGLRFSRVYPPGTMTIGATSRRRNSGNPINENGEYNSLIENQDYIFSCWREEFLLELGDLRRKNKFNKEDKVIDVMRGKNKITLNPTVSNEEYHYDYLNENINVNTSSIFAKATPLLKKRTTPMSDILLSKQPGKGTAESVRKKMSRLFLGDRNNFYSNYDLSGHSSDDGGAEYGNTNEAYDENDETFRQHSQERFTSGSGDLIKAKRNASVLKLIAKMNQNTDSIPKKKKKKKRKER